MNAWMWLSGYLGLRRRDEADSFRFWIDLWKEKEN